MRGRAGDARPKKRLIAEGEGGGATVHHGFCASPMTAPIILLQGEMYELVFSFLGQILHCWVGQYGRGQQKQTRALSLAEPSHETLTRESREAAEPIARPGEDEAIGSISIDPQQASHLCKYYQAETHELVSPGPCNGLGLEVSLGEDASRPSLKSICHTHLKASA